MNIKLLPVFYPDFEKIAEEFLLFLSISAIQKNKFSKFYLIQRSLTSKTSSTKQKFESLK